MDKIKVLFQKAEAENCKTREIEQVVFQHLSKPIDFRDIENRKIITEINNYRVKKFGDLKPVMEGDLKQFTCGEVFEVVIDQDGNSFERAKYKLFISGKWNPENMDPIKPKRRWKRLSKEEIEMKTIISDEIRIAFADAMRSTL